jgi:arabinofuranosyltransferase
VTPSNQTAEETSQRPVAGLLGPPWPRLAGWAGWLGMAAVVTARFAGRAGDDIYITYRYAYNLAHGRGLVFNAGERVFGVSDPGLALLLAGLHAATGCPIPILGTLITAAALLLIAGILLSAARAGGREAEGWLGGTLLLGSAYLWIGQGAGPLPALALLLLAARLADRWPPWRTGILAGLAFCCRPDAALGAAALAGLLVVEAWRPAPVPPSRPLASRLTRPMVFSAAFATIAIAAIGIAWAYFGSPLPGTMTAKRNFAALAPQVLTGVAFWRTAFELFCYFAGGWPGGQAFLVLGILGQAWLFRGAGRTGRLLVLYGLASAAFYSAAKLPFFIWYAIPTAIALLYGAPFLVVAVVRRLDSKGTAGLVRQAAPVLAGSLGAMALLSALGGGYRWWSEDVRDWRLFAYRKAGEWIRANTPPAADVVFDEVGILGYYSDRTVEDLIGLVSPSSRPFAAVGDPLGAFLAKPADLVLFHTYNARGGTRPILVRPWFAGAYREVAVISDPAAHAETRIYRRRPGTLVPPPRPPWRRPQPPPAREPTPSPAVIRAGATSAPR